MNSLEMVKLLSALNEMAEAAAHYYEQLQRHGFSAAQALELTKTMTASVLQAGTSNKEDGAK